jgi:hypothetical protein
MLKLLKLLDKAIGYAYIPPDTGASISEVGGQHEHLASAIPYLTGADNVDDVQERWVDRKEAWDEWEKKQKDQAGGP